MKPSLGNSHRFFHTLSALAILLAMLAQPASGQESVDPVEGPMEIHLPEGLDPNDNSGWLSIELAVLIDDRSETLNSEFWPPFPEARFPKNYRWLMDAEQVASLSARYPLAKGTQDAMGNITLSLPDPMTLIAEAQKAAADALAQAEAENQALTPEHGDAATDAPSDSDGEMTEGSSTPDQVPLELIDAPAKPTRASVDWLEDFEQSTADENAVDNEDAAATVPLESLESPDLPDDQPLPEPVLPTPFTRQPVVMLERGLRALTRDNPDRIELSTGWLQPPEGANVPIILTEPGDERPWPPLQGFVELRRGTPMRLGINFWWHTDANYYPENYSMSPPPATPNQVSVVDRLTQQPLTPSEQQVRVATLKNITTAQMRGEPIVEFVDPNTGFFVDNKQDQTMNSSWLDADESLEPPSWPWRHLIQVADTRTLPEGSVRYFDHPVVKVIATWRELTWGEVYTLGEQEREAAEAQAAIEEAAMEQARVQQTNRELERGAMVPPGDPAVQ